MEQYELYVFFLCLIVFVLLIALSAGCIYFIMKLSLRVIRGGLDDEQILADDAKKKSKKQNKYLKIANYAFSCTICLIFVLMFISSIWIRYTENSHCGTLPSFRVVQTGSMAQKHPSNAYLDQNHLDDQIQSFDLIQIEKLPDEMELELYDIVVYEVDGILLVHRIVEIQEPNAAHPDCRYFRLQGDAVEHPDFFTLALTH